MATTEKHENGVTNRVTAGKLPDGWKMYDKYQIRHTDGTPLKGKRYFVLRLDSDDEGEAGRVAAAMSAYKGETLQGNIAKMRKALVEIDELTNLLDIPENKKNLLIAPSHSFVAVKMRKIIKRALEEPPRNCDRFKTGNPMKDAEDAYDAWQRYCDDPTIPPSCKVESAFRQWLFATAKQETEGEKDGSK